MKLRTSIYFLGCLIISNFYCAENKRDKFVLDNSEISLMPYDPLSLEKAQELVFSPMRFTPQELEEIGYIESELQTLLATNPDKYISSQDIQSQINNLVQAASIEYNTLGRWGALECKYCDKKMSEYGSQPVVTRKLKQRLEEHYTKEHRQDIYDEMMNQ